MPSTEYRLVAHNPATGSENRIHADDVARRHGFRGGLVPGVTVYAYVVHALVDAFGPEWVERGSAAVRFRSPYYEGEQVYVRVDPDGAVTAGVGDEVRVTGWGSLDGSGMGPGLAAGSPPPDVPPAIPPTRDERPPAGVEELSVGRVLGSIRLKTDPGYLAKVDEPSPLYASRGWLHPGELLEGANGVLMANVVLPAWLHVESEVHHLRAVSVGEAVEVRGRVVDQWERKGHQFVTLDVVWVSAGEGGEHGRPEGVVAWARHTAIWQLAD